MILPMLATAIDQVRDLEFPAWIQPKLDGHRAVVVKRDGQVTMHSRTGIGIKTMGHILEALDPLMDDGEALDGELYRHGLPLGQITSLIQRAQPDSRLIRFHCFDTMMPEPFDRRLARVVALLPDQGDAVRVPTWLVASEQDALDRTRDLIAQGYEGAILRLPDHRYMNATRSDRVLKIKARHLADWGLASIAETRTM